MEQGALSSVRGPHTATSETPNSNGGYQPTPVHRIPAQMGSSRRHQRNSKPQTQLRSRNTRSRGKPLLDPAQNPRLLTEQLRALGLYAAPTLGDGNCLFRALSDQLHGTPSHHFQLRKDICDWINAHKQRYEPFVEDERGLDDHLRCMREPATYGGHLELSAFAHLTRRNVKVVQPGLVYVIEWDAGGDLSPDRPLNPGLSAFESDPMIGEREKRKLRRDQKRAEREKDQTNDHEREEASGETIYVAYHDWEHFSSIRNAKGPHTGLPHVAEIPAEDAPPSPKKKSPAKAKSKAKGRKGKPVPSITETTPSPSPSRATSPTSTLSQTPFPESSAAPSPSPLSAASPPTSSSSSHLPPGLHDHHESLRQRLRRSPKRAFDESDGGSSSCESVAKRTRNSRRTSNALRRTIVMVQDGDDDDDDSMDVRLDGQRDRDLDSTPGLSAPGSSADSSSSSSLLEEIPQAPVVSVSKESPLPVSIPMPTPPPPERPLTKRQRKARGLPKHHGALLAAPTGTGSGKIVIPGGRFKRNNVGVGGGDDDGDDDDDDDDEEDEPEWKRNGTGRVDVRGFRELKI